MNDCKWLIDPLVLCGARIPEFGMKQKRIGYRVVIGSSFTVEVAHLLGMEGILLCKGINIIHGTIENTLKLYHVQQEKPCQISQLSALSPNIIGESRAIQCLEIPDPPATFLMEDENPRYRLPPEPMTNDQ